MGSTATPSNEVEDKNITMDTYELRMLRPTNVIGCFSFFFRILLRVNRVFILFQLLCVFLRREVIE